MSHPPAGVMPPTATSISDEKAISGEARTS
jgi:hypothetical protein